MTDSNDLTAIWRSTRPRGQPGTAGEREMRKRNSAPFADVTADPARRGEVTGDEINGWRGHMGWSL
jgi:hypothetical protein